LCAELLDPKIVKRRNENTINLQYTIEECHYLKYKCTIYYGKLLSDAIDVNQFKILFLTPVPGAKSYEFNDCIGTKKKLNSKDGHYN
jgi:hypothetical protein